MHPAGVPGAARACECGHRRHSASAAAAARAFQPALAAALLFALVAALALAPAGAVSFVAPHNTIDAATVIACLFETCDSNRDGNISRHEMQWAFHRAMEPREMYMAGATAEIMFKHCDREPKDGRLSIDEMTREPRCLSAVEVQTMQHFVCSRLSAHSGTLDELVASEQLLADALMSGSIVEISRAMRQEAQLRLRRDVGGRVEIPDINFDLGALDSEQSSQYVFFISIVALCVFVCCSCCCACCALCI